MAKKSTKSTKRKTKTRKVRKKRGSKKKPGLTRKDATSNSGLKKQYFSRIKQEYHDIDYADKLSEKDKKWLASFMDEDLGARFNHEGKKIYKRKRDIKASYNRNNARNRDEYSITKASGRAVDIPVDNAFQYWEENYVNPDIEDNILDGLEKQEKVPLLSLDEYHKLKEQLVPDVRKFYIQHYKLQETLENTELIESQNESSDSE